MPPDLTGAMIYRSSNGFGTSTITGVAVGVSNYPGSFDIKAFALEMVAIPQADQYYLGDGGIGTYYLSGPLYIPFKVTGTSIVMGNLSGQLNDGINNGVLNAGFPIGYGYFGNLYMMKHEVSQGAYRDFLNTLTYTQQTSRTLAAPNSVIGTEAIGIISSRNGIQIATSGSAPSNPAVYGCNLNNNGVFNEASDGEWIGCGFLTWMDLAAFLDWAALRPMTELEFEKSCRGPNTAIYAENAAGTTQAAAYTYPIANGGTANESATYLGSVLLGNFTYFFTTGTGYPTRVGMHATPGANRVSSGAGYYGCLDLSGNIVEYTVTTANVAGRSFSGAEGDGTLTAVGEANVDYWPGMNGNTSVTIANLSVAFSSIGVTGAAGIIERGGGASSVGGNVLKVSYRVNPPGTSTRNLTSGGRGVKLM